MTDRSALIADALAPAASGADRWTHAHEEAQERFSLPELISRQAALTPTATALICGDKTLTYRELETAACKLAARLRRAGLAPEERVAVLVDRSLEMVAALYGILKAGNAYVPLDPIYPRERLAYILADAQPAAIVTKSSLLSALPYKSIESILLDDLEPSTASIFDAGESRAAALDPNTVAYIIYTSGSTGAPKGVQIQHRSIANLLHSMRRQPGLTANDTLLAVTTISFDIAVLELFLPLIVGAKIILARETDVIDGAALDKLMQHHGVTVLQATPATWQLLIAAGWRNRHLKMLCGGEALSRTLADELLARGGELWNMYGPTETTVWSSVLRIPRGGGPVLLGPPIANTEFYVLDEKLHPVTPGQRGELFIGGEGVALGYVDRPELTAAKFLTHAAIAPERRIYRTGDIVRARKHQSLECLEFLGRADHQVKIRGYRIELGEIEATLLRHPAVAEAVVVHRRNEDDAEEPTLQAFVTLRAHHKARLTLELTTELRAALQKFLPAYMQPTTLSILEELPRTPNGKVDRKALPQLASTRGPEKTSGARELPTSPRLSTAKDDVRGEIVGAFRSEIEAKLAVIWRSLLPRSQIDPAANFFLLGGTSLLAARLLERIEAEFAVRLSLPALFAAPSLAEQAQLLRKLDKSEYDFRQTVRLNANGSRPPLLVIHNTGVYAYRLAQLLGPEQPLIGLQLFDPTREIFPTTLEAIAAEYIRLIEGVQTQGPYQLIGWCVGGVLAYEIARQLHTSRQAISFLGMIDSWAPGHLRRMSRLRAWLTDRSFRIQLILTDWRKTRSGQQTVMDFFRNRVALQRLLRMAGDVHSQPLQKMFADRKQSGEHYDRWLGRYLEDIAERYEPGAYAGRVKLLRSSLEPRGWLLDPLMGWMPFASQIETELLDGDHFTVFRGRGLQQLSSILTASLVPSADNPR